jgi:hypothetical protein
VWEQLRELAILAEYCTGIFCLPGCAARQLLRIQKLSKW